MSNVFVIDTTKKALNPVHPARARLLLTRGKAAVFRRYPFTIILKREVEHPDVQPLRLKIDPGSKTTGLAIVNDATGDVVWTAELAHRGQAIKEALEARLVYDVHAANAKRGTENHDGVTVYATRKDGCRHH